MVGIVGVGGRVYAVVCMYGGYYKVQVMCGCGGEVEVGLEEGVR